LGSDGHAGRVARNDQVFEDLGDLLGELRETALAAPQIPIPDVVQAPFSVVGDLPHFRDKALIERRA
jgi:hypothetical protein